MIFVKRVMADLWILTDEKGENYSGKTAVEVIESYEKVLGHTGSSYTVGMDMESTVKDIQLARELMKEEEDD